MSNDLYIGSNTPGGKFSSTFFALFTRGRSDAITKRIVSILSDRGGFGIGPISDSSSLRKVHTGLPPVDYAAISYDLLSAHALFSKNGDMKTEIDPEKAAYESFVMSEQSCSLINEQLSLRTGPISTQDAVAIRTYASQYIASVLGNCPTGLGEIDFRFGPGANVSDVKVKYTTPNVKLSGSLTFSNSLLPLIGEVRATLPHIEPKGPVCGRLEFVPKNFKTHRSIMVEPGINSGFQMGVGSLLKRRLYMHGIDLTDQSTQRERARIGSIHDSWATIDLSRASDSIAYSLVMDLLPWDWFLLLDTLRTPMCMYRKKFILLEKFSSMGNGYTFELETLIFKGLIRGIAKLHGIEDDSSVYGDDITCNQELALKILEFFPVFGFEVNRDKSFVSGPFREACGGDYHLGVDVRPWFLRSLRDGGRWSIQKLFSFHNFLYRKPWFDPDRAIRTELLSLIPDEAKLWGPDGYGDGHLLSDADVSTYLRPVSTRGPKRFYEGWRGLTYTALPMRIPQKVHTVLPCYTVYAGYSREDAYRFDIVRVPKGVPMISRVTKFTVLQKC